jgi:hypothetical protein
VAVTLLTGFEGRAGGVDNSTLIGTAAYSTAQARTGAASIRCNPASAANGYVSLSTASPYQHFGLFIGSLPSVDRYISGNSTNNRVLLTSDGHLKYYNYNADLVGTSTGTLSTGTWYWLGVYHAATYASEVLVQVDGADFVAATGDFSGGSGGAAYVGVWGTDASAIDIYIDDLILDNAGFLAPSKVGLLLPVSDNTRDTLWTDGILGTTNLYEAVNNTPPVGSGTETATSQIEHAGGAAGTTDEYAANMTTWETAGVESGDTILALQSVIAWGEDSSTGTKLLSYSGQYPTWTGESSIDVSTGHGSGAVATYGVSSPDYWNERRSPIKTTGLAIGTDITLTVNPKFRVIRPETASRVASVCFMGIYIAWTPASGPTDWVKTAGDTLASLSEAAVRLGVRARTSDDALATLAEVAARVKGMPRTAGDALATLTDAVARGVMAKVRAADDALATLSEAIVRLGVRARSAGDALATLSEANARAVMAKGRTTGDTLATLSEANARAVMAKARTIADEALATLSEAVTAVKGGGLQNLVATAGDALATLSEAVGRAFIGTRQPGDSLATLSEAVVRLGVRARTTADALATLAEANARAVMGKARAVGDALATLAEANARAFIGTRAVGDALATLSEVVVGVKSGIQNAIASVGDSLASLSEAAGRAFVGARGVGDALSTLTDGLSRALMAKGRTGADALSTVTEGLARGAGAKVRGAGDALSTVTEAIAGVRGFIRSNTDQIGTLAESAARGTYALARGVGETVVSLAESAVRAGIAFIRREHRPSD